jgi:hypothetical protein
MNTVQLEDGERVVGVNAVLFSEGHKWSGQFWDFRFKIAKSSLITY